MIKKLALLMAATMLYGITSKTLDRDIDLDVMIAMPTCTGGGATCLEAAALLKKHQEALKEAQEANEKKEASLKQ